MRFFSLRFCLAITVLSASALASGQAPLEFLSISKQEVRLLPQNVLKASDLSDCQIFVDESPLASGSADVVSGNELTKADRRVFVIGRAFSKSSSSENDPNLVYCEYHLLPGVSFKASELKLGNLGETGTELGAMVSLTESLVVYKSADQTLIAVKRLDFADESGRSMLPASSVGSKVQGGNDASLATIETPDYNTAPNFSLDDFRSGQQIYSRTQLGTGEKLDDTYNVNSLDVGYRQSSQAKLKQKILSKLNKPVVDAGFLNAIRNNWDSLDSGEPLDVSFVSPPHRRAITLRVLTRPIEQCKGVQAERIKQSVSDLVCLEAKAASSLIRLFSTKISLLYQPSSERLYLFSGISNLEDDEGRNQQVEIAYEFIARD